MASFHRVTILIVVYQYLAIVDDIEHTIGKNQQLEIKRNKRNYVIFGRIQLVIIKVKLHLIK